MERRNRFSVVIAGGGPAALEAALALDRIAGTLVTVAVLTPDDAYLRMPMTVLSPFAACGSGRLPLGELLPAARAHVRRGRLASVDVASRIVRTGDGEELRYDALLVATGGLQRSPYPRALAFGPPGTDERMHGLIQDMEGGYVESVAFVVAPQVSWPLPLYELALMTAERAYGMCLDVDLTFVTPEAEPLAVSGPDASREIRGLLEEAGIRLLTHAPADVPRGRSVELRPAHERLDVDRVVTLPLISGPSIDGLPHDDDGFLPIDPHGRVCGAAHVYAAGDVANFAIKQGGLACLQADAAAEAIAAEAGVPIEPAPLIPVLRAVLVTEREHRWLQRNLMDDLDQGTIAAEPRWSPPTKFAARELAGKLPQIRLRRSP